MDEVSLPQVKAVIQNVKVYFYNTNDEMVAILQFLKTPFATESKVFEFQETATSIMDHSLEFILTGFFGIEIQSCPIKY
jgi:predicted NAD-dependent protein-ADP-ribosyltransferase YbiA (DUF1768 family)